MPGKLRPAIPTMSLGHGAAGYTMERKLRAAASAGFEGIEIFYACLESFALSLPGDETKEAKLLLAAGKTKELCAELGLTIVVLQPLLNYEGILDVAEHAARVEEVKFRFKLCKELGTDMLQVPANFRLDDGVSGEESKIVADLQEIADLGLKEDPPIRFAYEAMCWSTTNYTWQQGWRVVQAVNRPNFSIVVDAFHIAGYEYADPTAATFVRPDGAERLKASLDELVQTVPGKSVLYAQLVDAERLDLPLGKGSKSPYAVEGQQPHMSWSRNCRLFPGEEDRGAFMPIWDCAQAFVDTGFEGWVSFELFNRFISVEGSDAPEDHAKRGWQSWLKLLEKLR